jgi:hypothetical protein
MSSAPWLDRKKCVGSRLVSTCRGLGNALPAWKAKLHETYILDKLERMQVIETKYVYYIFLKLFLQLYFQRIEQI